MGKFLSALFVLLFTSQVFATTWTVVDAGFTFSSDSITITQGDTVNFVLGGSHNAQEVDQLTWNANNSTPVTGFTTPFTGGIVTGLSVGVHYYVCVNHAGSGMKGRIFVQAAQTPPSVEFVITSSTYNEGVGSFGIAVSILNPNANQTTVDINVVAGGTATAAGVDYSFSPVTVVFPPNSSVAQIVTVTLVNDQLIEGPENFTLQLAFPTNNATIGSNAQLAVTITDNDQGDCSDLFFSEYIMAADPGTALEIFNPTSQPMDLGDYRVLLSKDGGVNITILGLNGMLAPNDVYIIANVGSQPEIISQADTVTSFLSFNGNDALALLHFTDTIDIIGQLRVNPGIGFVVDNGSTWYNTIVRKYYNFHGSTDWNTTLQTWFGYPAMYDSLGFHNMAPCGSSPPKASIRFISSGVTVPESLGSPVDVIVEVVNPTASPVSFTVGHNNAASSATFQADYYCLTPTFTANPGTSYYTLLVTVHEDQLLEPTETAVLYLTNLNGNGLFITDSVFNLNITDNDVLTVSFNGAGFTYVEDTSLVEVKITLSGSVADTTSVLVSLSTGNATKGVDFTFNDTVIVFPPFTMDTQSVWVRIIDDAIVEPNEQINFDMINATNGAVIAISAYKLTIIDNDSPSGIEEMDFAELKLYPNPVMNKLVIQTETELTNVEVTDFIGSNILQLGNLPAGKNTVDVSFLAAGMYFLNVHSEQNIFSKRFIKQD